MSARLSVTDSRHNEFVLASWPVVFLDDWSVAGLEIQTMLGHASAVLTLDTYADLFPDDLEQVSAALDAARIKSLKPTADQLRTEMERGPNQNRQLGPLTSVNTGRGDRI